MSDFGRALQDFGQSLGTLGKTIYAVDAKRQADEAQIEISRKVENWKTSLLANPDYGRVDIDPTTGEPIFMGGYFDQWKTMQENIRTETIGAIQNPLARREVEGYFDQMAIEQGAQVKALQFKKWGETMILSSLNQIDQYNNQGGIPVQAKIDHAAEKIGWLTQHNLLDPAKADEYMDAMAQGVFTVGLKNFGMGMLQAGRDIADVEQAIMGDNTMYRSGTKFFSATDMAKNSAMTNLTNTYNAIQVKANDQAQKAYFDFVSKFPDGTGFSDAEWMAIRMTFQGMQAEGVPMNAASRQAWEDRIGRWKVTAEKKDPDSELARRAGEIMAILYKGRYAVTSTTGQQQSNAKLQYRNGKGEMESIDTTPAALWAFANSPEVDAILVASEKWDTVTALFYDMGKERGAWEGARGAEEYKEFIKNGSTSQALEAEASLVRLQQLYPNADPLKIADLLRSEILAPQYKVQVSDALAFNDRRYDNFDTFIEHAASGKFKNAVVNGEIKGLVYRDALPANAARIQKRLNQELGATTTTVRWDPTGFPWFDAKPSDAQAPKGYESAKLAVVPFQEGGKNDSVIYRELTGTAGWLRQARIWNGKDWEWIDVRGTGTGYTYQNSTDRDKILKSRSDKKSTPQPPTPTQKIEASVDDAVLQVSQVADPAARTALAKSLEPKDAAARAEYVQRLAGLGIAY